MSDADNGLIFERTRSLCNSRLTTSNTATTTNTASSSGCVKRERRCIAAAAIAATTSRPNDRQSFVHRGEIVNCIRTEAAGR
ncbi:hypothetical protein ACH3XW_46705 [Acanthocheilonema viteae]